MAKKKLLYLVLDCETATFPFANEIAEGDTERKKRIAIARPLIYDIGWTIVDRGGNIHDKKQFLIAEIFSVPSVFNTAYYAEKRPIYLEMLKRGETTIKPWEEAIAVLIEDMAKVNAVGAFNSMFDFKKAIPFTELYIKMLYSPNYFAWEQIQKKLCYKIAFEPKNNKSDPDFDPEHFLFRGIEYNLFDLWGLATTHLLNNASYKNKCLENAMLTQSGTYFKTSAESSYRYLCNKYDFIEAHTALDDAIIESFILHKVAQKHAITIGIKYFPFRDLGYTDDFCMRLKKPKLKECTIVYNTIANYINTKYEENPDLSNYTKGLYNRLLRLAEYMGIEAGQQPGFLLNKC